MYNEKSPGVRGGLLLIRKPVATAPGTAPRRKQAGMLAAPVLHSHSHAAAHVVAALVVGGVCDDGFGRQHEAGHLVTTSAVLSRVVIGSRRSAYFFSYSRRWSPNFFGSCSNLADIL